MYRKKSKILAVLLAASLLFPSNGITAMAGQDFTEPTSIEAVSSSEWISAGDAATGLSAQESDSDILAEAASQTSDGNDPAATPSQLPEGDASAETSSQVSEGDASTDGVSSELTDGTEAAKNIQETSLFPGLPEGYVFSQEELNSKRILSEHAEDFSFYIEEDNTELYVKGELVFLADSEEEAQMIADAFGSELVSFEWGVAVIRLSEDRTVAQACLAAADSKTLLPAVWPNYYKELYINHNDPALKDTNTDYQWQHEFVGDYYAWDAGYKGQGVKIGILDTGILASHIEFQGRIANAADSDVQGHGTHVAGIAAANLDNSSGGAGIAPEASLYIYAIGDKNGSITMANEQRGIEQAIAAGVDVINMSFGNHHYTELEDNAIQKAYKSGIAVFAAAGNDSSNTRCYPASYNNVCSIASLQQDGRKSSFSNYNDAVDLAFPGSDIYSTSRNGNEQYEYKDGTSMACPVAVGTAAVILSGSDKLSSLKGKTGSVRVDALFKIMKQNVNKCSSKGTGAGTTYLPKVFKLNTNSTSSAPAAPAFSIPNKKSFDTPTAQLQITGASYGVNIYYSTNGKAPTYKNGAIKNGTLYSPNTNITIGGAKSVTVKAIAVNTLNGKASKAVSATYTFAPTPTQVEIISDSVNQLALGTNLNLKAAVTPSYAVSTKVKWSVAPAGAGVTINASGKLSVAKTATTGSYTITATAVDKKGNDYMVNGKSVSESVTITVIEASANIKSITLSKKSGSLPTGKTLNLADGITITNADKSTGDKKNIVWSSSNTKVATVSPEGVVTAVAPGQANIKATANDGSKKSATCKLTVANSLVITGSNKLAAGKSITLKATLDPNTVSCKSFDWSVSGTGVTVKNGKLTASKSASGTYIVTATATKDGLLSNTHEVTIVSDPIKSISFDKKNKNVTLFYTDGAKGLPTSKILKPEVTGGDSTAVTYTSSAPGIATVDENGVVHALKCGKAKITCQATDGSNKKAVCNVTVNAPASRITVVSTDDSDGFVCVGSSIKLAAVVGTSYGTPSKSIEWSVTKGSEELISVDKKGVVKAKSLGNTSSQCATASVTATASDGSNSGTYKIYVLPKITKIKLEPAGISTDGALFVVSATLDNGKELNSDLLSYKVDVTLSGNYKAGVTKASDMFAILANKSTTNRVYSPLIPPAGLFTTDGTKIKVKVTVPSCKKSASLSGYLVQFSNGYAGFFTVG
ncbi:MAG: S8 family serine peptidase [Butyrivibrio sp.]|nr:S8 family serine peptidase [Muribaculum sp.]MCM1551990.1 S8 family serine peptidase [Butyrivibrio sp.]